MRGNRSGANSAPTDCAACSETSHGPRTPSTPPSSERTAAPLREAARAIPGSRRPSRWCTRRRSRCRGRRSPPIPSPRSPARAAAAASRAAATASPGGRATTRSGRSSRRGPRRGTASRAGRPTMRRGRAGRGCCRRDGRGVGTGVGRPRVGQGAERVDELVPGDHGGRHVGAGPEIDDRDAVTVGPTLSFAADVRVVDGRAVVVDELASARRSPDAPAALDDPVAATRASAQSDRGVRAAVAP